MTALILFTSQLVTVYLIYVQHLNSIVKGNYLRKQGCSGWLSANHRVES